MIAKINSGGGFRLVNDPMLVAHCSVAVLTPRDDTMDLYFLLGVLNSKVFARYVSLTMPRISAGRFSLRLSPLRQFSVPNSKSGANETACRHIASLVGEWLRLPTTHLGQSDVTDIIEEEVARLYGCGVGE